MKTKLRYGEKTAPEATARDGCEVQNNSNGQVTSKCRVFIGTVFVDINFGCAALCYYAEAIPA